ncbi:MAG TPA: hypothetical protein VF756_31440 [Thermoanaerobaculia bacterium]
MSDLSDPKLTSAVVRMLLGFGDVTQEELGEGAGRSDTMIYHYVKGHVAPPPPVLDNISWAVGLTPPFVRSCLAPTVEKAQAIGRRLSEEGAWDLERAAAALEAALAGPARPALLTLLQAVEATDAEPWQWKGAPSPEDRIWAADACQRLMACTAAERRDLIETCPKFQTWAVATALCDESARAASDQADAALDLAERACRVAELASVGDLFRSRLQGYCLVFVANAERVSGHLRRAEATFARAMRLWEQGAQGDLESLLAEWRLLDLEASLRRAQRRFDHALNLLDRARAAAPDGAQGHILLNQSSIYAMRDEPERALASLLEAEPWAEKHGDLRQRFGMRFNQARCLCDLERFSEAQALLPQVRGLAEELGNKLDNLRVRWLDAKILAGFGRKEEARQAYEEVRQAFADDKVAYDYALVSLELALPLLNEGRTTEVRALAEEMVWIFEAEGVPENALAALTVFCQAAKQETVTVELTRRVLRFLERAREDPERPFEP